VKAKVERAWVEVVADDDPDTSWLEQEGFEDRLAALKRGDFGFVGVRACAQIRFETSQGGWINGPIVKSPGLWGIEDDSGEEYFREIGDDEAAELANMLKALNVAALMALPEELCYR
jgi:hypothetical protein